MIELFIRLIRLFRGGDTYSVPGSPICPRCGKITTFSWVQDGQQVRGAWICKCSRTNDAGPK